MTNLEGLDAEQLKERLLVAETIMKKLYVRNKELEEYYSQISSPDILAAKTENKTDSKHKELSDQIRFDLY